MAEENNNLHEEITNSTSEDIQSEEAETIFEETTTVDSNENIASDVQEQELLNKTKELEMKLEESENRYLRLQADFDNFRRRTKLEAEANAKYKAQNVVTDLLPALDNFERALKMEADNEQTKSLLQGMEMVYRSLIDALKKEGVEAIESVGKEFNPYLHQAVMQVEDENFASNTVIEEFQKGYQLKDRVIRPAMVKVSQ
ncbi:MULTISPECIES: nucleotide exchange factor GrpE [unclassified Bacillus (in: firmicutes)]|uniref:nucleotide exchange factor GrpE n=1 Tax=unclassified Bacillus (in: firmicutes) TaxID=185979 RepID=UPI0008F0617C|nr:MULTISPECIES: nucleotide exchange factor GrpE [unclassified Bacillus (in: firmicutes)]SFA95525.1 molecular chaperone GrpE [Bacillus sp. UNCCL13]SFQ79154.1 molecular chaperone GrpE [Bacillus sp. cl95]